MKFGAENRNKLLLTAGLMIVAVVLLIRAFAGNSAPASANTTPSPAANSAAAKPASTFHGVKPVLAANSLDPSLRLDLLRAGEQASYKGNGRNIFKSEPEPPPIPSPVCTPQGAAPKPGIPSCRPLGPQQPPPPPPIDLKFFGFASAPGEPRKVFLSQGGDIFIASEGEIVDRRYKVIHINAASVEIEDVLNNHRETISLTQG